MFHLRMAADLEEASRVLGIHVESKSRAADPQKGGAPATNRGSDSLTMTNTGSQTRSDPPAARERVDGHPT